MKLVDMRSHLFLESAAKNLDAPEVHGALESFSEASVLTSLPADLAETFAAADNQEQRQQSNDNRSPYRNCSTNTTQLHRTCYMFVLCLNSLPEAVVHVDSLILFKKHFKTHLYHCAYLL